MKTICDYTYHSEALEILNGQITNNKTSQGYLFVGSAATQKEEVAVEFAKSINDISDDITRFPDIKILYPEGINGYLIGQIKTLISDLSKAPIFCKYKVNIICNAEAFNDSSANAFLKSLEEPPEYVINILLCSSTENVLPTIVSRCQVIKFCDLNVNDAKQIVVKESGASDQQANKALQYFYGDITKSIEYLQNQDQLDLVDYVEKIISNNQNYQFSDWTWLEYSERIHTFIQDMSKKYKDELSTEFDEKSEVLENSALKEIEKLNKRKVSTYQINLMKLVTSVCLHNIESKIKQDIDVDNNIIRLDTLTKMQGKLRYNVSLQTYCDVLLMKVKNDNYSSDKNGQLV